MARNLHDICMRFPGGKSKCLTLSYDDGVVQDIRMCELMKKWNIAGTFNINTGYVAPDDAPVGKRGPLSMKKCKETYLSSPLFEVATHCLTHPFTNRIPLAEAALELLEDRKNIEENFGSICRGHAYPYGAYTNDIIDLFRMCGIAYARTTHTTLNFGLPKNWLELKPTCHHKNPELMNLAEKFVSQTPAKEPWLFYLWGHTYEFDDCENWSLIEDFFEKIANKDDVWYATNIQVYDYVKAYESLIFSVDGNTIYNPTSTTVWILCNNDKLISISPGQTIDAIS